MTQSQFKPATVFICEFMELVNTTSSDAVMIQYEHPVNQGRVFALQIQAEARQ
jgi:hypothetical protein